MRRALLLLSLALMTQSVGGCAPELGIAPVLCTEEFECPNGYRCIERASENLCVRQGYSLDDVREATAPDIGVVVPDYGYPDAGSANPDYGHGSLPPLPDTTILDRGSDAPSKARVPRLDGALVQPSVGCQDEPSEPNNSGSTATKLSASTQVVSDLEVCYPGDVDLYEIPLQLGDQLSVQILFAHAAGDLEVALLGPDGVLLAERRSESDNEDFTLVAAPMAGKYLVAVWGFAGATNSYDLQLN